MRKFPALLFLVLALGGGRLVADDSPPRLVGAPKLPPAPRLESVKLTPAAADENAAPKDAAVRVVAGEAGGSGVVVWSEAGRTLVATNKHVVAGASAYTVTHTTTGKRCPAKLVGWSDEGDVAILELAADLTPARLGTDAAPGDRVTHYGNATGPQSGRVEFFQDMTAPRVGWSGKNMHAEYLSDSGDSGAGVYNTAGELVAVHWGGRIPGWPSSSAPVSVVRNLLARVAGDRFPRLSARLAAPAGVAAVVQPTAPPPRLSAPTAPAAGCTSGVCVAGCPCLPAAGKATAPAAPAVPGGEAKRYQVGSGPWLTATEFRAQYPHLAGITTSGTTYAAPAGSGYFLTAPGSCPGGRCPTAR